MLRNIFIMTGFLTLFATTFSCGRGDDNGLRKLSLSEIFGEAGYIQLSFSDAENRGFSEIVAITKYKITLFGDGIETLEQVISKGANGIAVEGIPAGLPWHIRVEALNNKDQVVREGIVKDVIVDGGSKVTIDVPLKAVPLFLNLSDGALLSNQRLYFYLFSDPGHFLTVETDRILRDVVSGEEIIQVGEGGTARIYPAVLSAGLYTFTLRDLDTGKSSTMTLRLWDGTGIKAAPLFAGSEGKSASTAIGLQRFGQAIASESGTRSRGGEFFPNIAEALWKTRQ